MNKVIVGISGGVDSSVCAWLLKQQGYEVEGLFMKNWEQDDKDAHCSAALDLADAQAVCQQLNIPLHTVNFAEDYWNNVFTYFLEAYQKGRTPNPDILCNKEIKFKLFFQYALQLGADFIATGHYARTKQIDGQFKLIKAKDREKDQTYFLHAINPNILSQVLFPIGDYLKSEVRQIAKDQHLITHDKKDSTGICFIGEKRFRSFLKEYLLAKPGEIIDTFGKSIGKHDGLMYYTIGQRQGLNIGGQKNAEEKPWYVVEKKINTNQLVVAQGTHHPLLYSQGLICQGINWLDNQSANLPLTCYSRIRHRQPEQGCLLSPPDVKGSHVVMFTEPQRAVSPGQYIVFYQQNVCIGGAEIEEVIK
jgi:tRNA-specific 2-thiouridylase